MFECFWLALLVRLSFSQMNHESWNMTAWEHAYEMEMGA
jgi:hypothetical protein